MKNILITGIDGFVGKALERRLISGGYNVIGMDRESDITEPESFIRLEEENIDYVFHLAGKTFVPRSWEAPLSFYQTNVTGTMNVLDFCRRRSIPLTHVSAYLYGQPEKLPISENDAIKPNNPYAHSKYLAEQLCEFYAAEFGVKTVIIRPFNIYGPSQSDHFLIPHIVSQAVGSEKIKVKDLSPKRDYLFIDDLIGALIMSMKSSKPFAVYNIGSGVSLSVEEIIQIVQDVICSKKEVVSEGEVRKNEINDVVADISNAKEDLGWQPSYGFKEGIRLVVGDYEKRKA